MKLCLDVIIACLAVFGFCCMIRTVLDFLIVRDRVWIAVIVRDEKDADMLDVRLHEAESAFFKKRGMRTVVLISSRLFQNCRIGSEDGILHDRYAQMIEDLGVDCYIIDWGDEEG